MKEVDGVRNKVDPASPTIAVASDKTGNVGVMDAYATSTVEVATKKVDEVSAEVDSASAAIGLPNDRVDDAGSMLTSDATTQSLSRLMIMLTKSEPWPHGRFGTIASMEGSGDPGAMPRETETEALYAVNRN